MHARSGCAPSLIAGARAERPPGARQGSTVRLETAHAALLEGDAASWEDALAHGASCWRLVAMVTPDA